MGDRSFQETALFPLMHLFPDNSSIMVILQVPKELSWIWQIHVPEVHSHILRKEWLHYVLLFLSRIVQSPNSLPIISIKLFSLNPIPASPSHLLFILPFSKKITVGTISTEYLSIKSSLSSIMTRR